MGELTYDQIVRRILMSEACMCSLPDGITISPLYISKKNDAICDCFIGYFTSSNTSICKVIRIDIENNKLIDCIDNELCMERQKDEFPGVDKYMELYPQVRVFAFSETLTSEQEGILQQFAAAWLNCCENSIREKLDEFFPEFNIWSQPFLVK